MSNEPKILVVDDEEIVAKSLHMLLSLDYDVKMFTNHSCGVDTINWLKDGNKIDYAILDILINGISGIDIAEEIMKDLGEIPIIFITGCATGSPQYTKSKEFAAKYDNIKFCTKPYNEDGEKYSDIIRNDLKEKFE